MQRRRSPYNTKSNKVRVVKTPGGELRYLYLKKKGTAPKCGDCGIKLPGVSLAITLDSWASAIINEHPPRFRPSLETPDGTHESKEKTKTDKS